METAMDLVHVIQQVFHLLVQQPVLVNLEEDAPEGHVLL